MIHVTRKVPALIFSLLTGSAVIAQGNDNCALAVAQNLAVDASITLSGNNSAASGVNDFAVGSIYAGSPVYWVKFTTTTCANIRVSYCGQNPVWGNTFAILASTCQPTDAQLVNANTFNTTDCGDGNRTIFFDLLPAGTWALPVLNDPGNNSSGPFNITVAATACVVNNDFCSEVIPETLNSGGTLDFSGDNTSASGTNDFDPTSVYFGTPVYWHAFTTTSCNNVQVRFCGTTPVWSNGLAILTKDCPGLTLVDANTFNTSDCVDGNRTYYYDLLPPDTYYIPVLSDAGSGSAGPYTVQVAATACVEVNDFCSQVFPQTLAAGTPLTFVGNNSAATGTNDFDSTSPFAGAPVNWHAFSTTGCNTVTVQYCGITPAFGNTFAFLATSCPALDLVNGVPDDVLCGDGNRTIIYANLPEGTYYVPVLNDPGNNSSGPYSIGVSAVICEYNYDNCAAAPAQPLAADESVTFSANNATAGGTGDWVTGSPFFGSPVNWHQFTTTACLDVSVSYCGTAPAWSNTLGLLANSCPADQVTTFSFLNNTDCADGNRTWIYDNLPPGTWYIPVLNDPGQNSSGPYQVTVSSVMCDIGYNELEGLDWSVFPNPSEGAFDLSYGGPTASATIELLDATGRSVWSERALLATGAVHTILPPGNLSAGSYQLRLITPNGSAVRRLMVR